MATKLGLDGLVGAVQFLTRVPIRLDRPVPHHRVVGWFPVVGALIGLVVGGVAYGARLGVGPTLAAALAVTVGLLVTGAFHEDGLADVADAFGGGWTEEQRLAILKDSRHGTYGVASLCASVVLRVVALAEVGSGAAMLTAAVAAHALARSAAVAALAVVPPATESGLGADVAKTAGRPRLTLGALSGVVIAAGVLDVATLVVAVAAVVVATVAVCALARRKIGGLVGDVLGAVEQVAEVAVLVAVAWMLGDGG
jgi:adenosylcobinamide-GDP ribazoletransferase